MSYSHAQGCDQNIEEHTWNQGQNNKLQIEVPAKTFKWKVEIEYDTAPTRLDAYQGKGEKCKKATNTCEFKNENWNRRLNPGDLLEVGYQIQFPQGSSTPEIVSLKFFYCDTKPCAKWKSPDDSIKELQLCPGEEETEAPTTPAETTPAGTEGTTEGAPDETTASGTAAPTEAPTEGPSTDGTTGETTESSEDGGCIGEINDFHNWESGVSGRFQITVPDDTETWEMMIEFDQPMDSIEAYEGSGEACDGNICTFSNEIWNGAQLAGNTLSLGFQAPGDFPEIVSFSFNGAACEAPPTTTEAPVETTTPAASTEGSTGETTQGSTAASTEASTTEASEGDCPEMETTQVWGSGLKGKLEFLVPEDVDEWEASITFDGPINSFDCFQGKDEFCEGTTCTFSSEQWNAIQQSGNTLTLEYQAQFDETATPPSPTGFSFNGVPICEGPTGGPTDGTTESSTDVPGEETTPGECTLGEDYPGATVGHLTHYSSNPSGNNCDLNWTNLEASGLDGWTYFGALPKNPGTDADRYEGGLNCGRCVKVKCSCEQEYDYAQGACQPDGQEVILMVTDSCPSCPYVGDLDLSTDAWNGVTGNADFSKFDGTWEFIECPSNFKTGPMMLRMKGGSSKWWYAFQPENHKNKVTSMDITFNGATTEMAFGPIDGFWWQGDTILEFPVIVEAKNEDGVCATVTLNSEDEVFGDNEVVMDGEC